ncbi:DUF1266 domain-containing protein [Streptomyces sp. NPDC006332]|uniref:DUF1266 domain-containing protein n=1 Tax=Streptomyces sp. NPDC006332 TaxID=3155456 RepID=UPI0033BBC144
MSFGPPPASFGPTNQPVWTPPTEIEQALFEAKSREDWSAYFTTLAENRLYFEVRRDRTDAEPGNTFPVFGQDLRTGGAVWAVYTEGMLPAPDRVFDWDELGWFARVWTPTYPPMIVVNPGSPYEAFLPSAPPHSGAWAQHSERAGFPSFRTTLRTLRVGGPLHGPVAHGLACGALLFVNNGLPWNAMAYHGQGYPHERKALREWWGVTSRGQWQEQQRALLALDGANPVWEFALSLRRTIARDFRGHVDTGYWRDAAAHVLRDRAAGETVITADGVTRTEPRPTAETEARIKGVQHLIGRITRYEARFRADGILDENRNVSSVDAWDLGRASAMARWGLGSRYCDLPEAEAAVVEAGRSASRSYRSWQDFAAGYILGRCLHFDDEEFGEWYTDVREAQRILMSDPGSPWLNIPFR